MEILRHRLSTAVVLAALAAAPALAAGPIRLLPSGPVDVREGSGEWRTVTGETLVKEGSEVRTHDAATAQLRFTDGSVVQIGNSALFAIDKTDAKETAFSLKLGKIRAAFAGLLSSRVSIRTPTAVCAVRGTVFDLGVQGKDTQVTMAEGVLEVKDGKGKQAVVTSEETLKIGENGMEKPHILPLSDPRALQAVRPYGVHQDQARDATRRMLEDLRNRELKANEAQLGKSVVDAFGRRVRLEEYLLRPDTKSFEVLFLSKRESRFDWGHLIEQFNAPIPNDLSQVPAIVQSAFFNPTLPSNWLKSMEFYATNTVDGEKELITMGAPVQVNFGGYNGGTALPLYYPSSIDFTQTLTGPGVPGGSRVQFNQHQDWNVSNPNYFTWTQSVPALPTDLVPTQMLSFTLNPASTVDVAGGGCMLGPCTINAGLYNATNPIGAPVNYPNGPNKADILTGTMYPDGSTVQVEKFLVSNDGQILDFAKADPTTYTANGNYNLEINVKSSLFQGRNIDVMIAPEILATKATTTKTPDSSSFKP